MAEILGFANNPAGTTPLAFAVPAGTRALVILTGTNLNFFADYDDLLVDGAPIAPLEVNVGGTPLTVVVAPSGELVNQPARAYFLANPPPGTIEIIPDPDTTSFINVWAIGGERDVEVVDVRGLVSASIANPSVTMQPGGRANTVLCEIAFSGQDTVSAFGPIDGNWTQHSEIDVGAQGVGVYSRVVADGSATAAGLSQTADDALIICVAVAEVSTLMLQSSRHTHQSEAASLDVGYTLSPQGSRHATQSDSVALQQVYALVLSQSRHSHEVDSVSLLQANTIGITDSHHAHMAGNVGLQQAHVIGVAGSRHGLTAEAAALVQAYTVGIHSAIHGQFAGRPSLLQSYVLALSEALHEHIAETVSLTVAGTLSPSDTSHAVVTENIGLTQAHVLPVLSATHTHTAGVSSFIQHYVTSFANARHGHVAGRIALEAFYGFGLQSSRHTHSAQNVPLTQAHVLFILDALHEHYAGTTLLRTDAWIPAELETLRMEIQRIGVMDVSFTVAVERVMAIVQRITRRFGF